MLLIHIRNFHRLTHIKGSCVRGIKPHDESEECSLSCSIRTNHTYNTIWWEDKIKIIEELFLWERFGNMFGNDNLITQARTIRNENLQFLLTLLLFLVQHLII